MRSFLLLLLFSGQVSLAQTVASYFEKNRNNEAIMTAFFTQMPKGGDLHTHYFGAIYAEALLEKLIEKDYFLNTETMAVSRHKGDTAHWESFAELKKKGLLDKYEQQIMQKWSIKDYNGVDYPSDKLFFEAFDKFLVAASEHYKEGLLELKNRAKNENVSYLEMQLGMIPQNLDLRQLQHHTQPLRRAAQKKDKNTVFKILDSLYTTIQIQNPERFANEYNEQIIRKLHEELKIDDPQFTMRYQNYLLRFFPPVDFFANLVLAFISANNSPLIAGINIVAPEDSKVALQDYDLQMLMFQYMHNRFPKVKYTLHAGELTLGLVKPEDLNFHVEAAVKVAQANRIGHGVDIAYETNSYETLKTMARKKIPVEINLTSNEFILKVRDNRHPILLYKQFGVPIVVSTDDAGILRTNLTEQFVLLAKRYPSISYTDIKQYVFNSIEYSFIQDEGVKMRLKEDLKRRFGIFEGLFEK